ncbi:MULTISPECIES: plastocyanin/azurin family copper-binding protein [unclassified Acidovorax]|jgi:uncharacterized cupredoxin-like copper-binding protein|nr:MULTISPECIES: cupredoxin family protein [unclassified Acidovorax]MDA8520984.1 cupredoxin family protein [Acidovorax sp. NCPPB 4044]GDY37512.1 blue copper protein [Acidovorax sp. NB1]
MKRTFSLIAASAVVALSFNSFAGGNHGGGHDGGGARGHGSAESAIGQPGKAGKVSRTINVDMADTMRFTPAAISVKEGETIKFVIKNSGQVKHEFSLGTEAELKEHYETMKKFPEMEHDEPSKISLAPGKQGEIIWQFTKAGDVNFACLYPGHYDAGMKGQVKVSKK